MSGLTSLKVGTLGLKAAQAGINTTSHNLANVYTKGYVRQTSVYTDYSYLDLKNNSNVNGKMQVGQGVYVAATSRVRDILLDSAYRQEAGRQAFYNVQYEAVAEVENFLGETEGTKFQDELTKLSSAIKAMAAEPGNQVARSELVMNAKSFLDRAASIYDNMTSYQKTLDTKVKNTVDRINELGNIIQDLNKQICAIEGPGIQNANDLRDLRDNALDELSSLVDISYKEDDKGIVTVKTEGVPFITDSALYEMGTAQLNGADGSTYLTPVWPALDNQPVFNLDVQISSARENDKGSLKGLLLARGDYAADYTDIPKEEDYADQADYYDAVEKYNLEIDSSVIMKAQALFDQLINGIVTAINEVFSPTTAATASFTGTDAAGNVKTYPAGTKILDTASCSVGEDGELPPQELFSRKDAQRYTQVTANDGTGTVYYVYNETNSFGNDSLYTCSNLKINQAVLEDYTKLPFKTRDGNNNDYTLGEDLVNAWSTPFASIDPNNITPKNFDTYYQEFVYEMGNMGDLFESISSNYAVQVSTIDSGRQQVTGVASEEELANMVKFQSAYNASSRYINVINDMLETIISKLT